MTASLSVIIPTFNRMPLVARALDSALAQRNVAADVIVVDDGSTDGTADHIRTYFPQASLIVQEHAGVSAARNRGIAAAKGEWIAFLDSDDYWMEDKLSRQMNALQEDPELRVCHCDEIWIRQGRRVNAKVRHAKSGGWIYPLCLPLCIISPSAAVIHRTVFDAVGVFDRELPACEDYDLWLRICSRYPVGYLAEKLLVKTGGHSDQLSRRYWGMDRFRIRALEKILREGDLSAENRRLTLQTLLKKLSIYRQGADKRQKSGLVCELDGKIRDCHARLAATAGQ